MAEPGPRAWITVGVAYARPDEQTVTEVTLPSDCRLVEAIEASGVLDRCAEIDLTRNAVGVFGRISALGAPLRHGDRVEIYRPLRADPKAQRRQRARLQRTDG